VLDPIPTFRRQLSDDPNLQGISGGNPIILGALTYDTNRKIYNSALGVQPDGTILPPYHKRVLMPFGEYTPMAEIFPFLKEMNASVGDFSAGTGPAVFGLKLQAGLEATLSVAPLICYEEVQPQFAAESVRSGAHLLVGLSNDAWFGDTAAPHQHHMIAAFRAIENRRSFVRSTNSGLSALLDPFGRTVATLPTFGEGVLEARLPLEDRLTIYTRYGNDLYWLIPLGILVLLRSLRTRTNSPYP
jgi:apolipoprotein N-acyltransferase